MAESWQSSNADGRDNVDMRKRSATRFITDPADEDGLVNMRNTTQKAHIRSATSSTTGFEDKDGNTTEWTCVLNASGPGVATGVVAPTAATIEKETSFPNVKLEDVGKDVKEVKKFVELMVRRGKKLDMKRDVAIRSLERLEQETHEETTRSTKPA